MVRDTKPPLLSDSGQFDRSLPRIMGTQVWRRRRAPLAHGPGMALGDRVTFVKTQHSNV